MPTTPNLLGTLLLTGIAGEEADPNATILRFVLLFDDSSGQVSGRAQITRGLVGPLGNQVINIGNVTGHVQGTGFGDFTRLIALQGEASVPFPPPAIGSLMEPFRALFAVDTAWNGVGGWTLGSQAVDNMPVHIVIVDLPEA